MKKRKFLVYINYRGNPLLIISYIDKHYKVYDFNDNDNLMFYPEKVKFEKCEDHSYFIRFGRLYRRCAINIRNSKEYHHKKYNRRVAFPVEGSDHDHYCKFFDDLTTAKLWLEVQEEEHTAIQDEECCEEASDACSSV